MVTVTPSLNRESIGNFIAIVPFAARECSAGPGLGARWLLPARLRVWPRFKYTGRFEQGD